MSDEFDWNTVGGKFISLIQDYQRPIWENSNLWGRFTVGLRDGTRLEFNVKASGDGTVDELTYEGNGVWGFHTSVAKLRPGSAVYVNSSDITFVQCDDVWGTP